MTTHASIPRQSPSPAAPASDYRSALLVASTGGHLAELHRLLPRIHEIDDRNVTWATFETSQSTALLAGEPRLRFVRLTNPRDWKNVLRNIPAAIRILREARYGRVVSTGSAVALTFLPLARLFGIQCDFIESAARQEGPSLTGRVMAKLPGVDCYTQCRSWESETWRYRGSLFDGFHVDRRELPSDRKARVVVTLGTMPHEFTAALEALVPLLEDDDRYDVMWQVGTTRAARMPAEWHESVPSDQLSAWIADADLVIAHGGLGSTLEALDAGIKPLLIPREAARNEHVDDHQLEIADAIGDRELATVVRVPDLNAEVIEQAIGWRIERDALDAARPFRLQTPTRRPA